LAVLEAMSAGIPVVTSDLPVFREYLVPGRDALLVEPGSVDGLAAALLTALEDVAVRRALVKAGAAVAARFTWAERRASAPRDLRRTRASRAQHRRDRALRAATPAQSCLGWTQHDGAVHTSYAFRTAKAG
jgi:hypothetical protein